MISVRGNVRANHLAAALCLLLGSSPALAITHFKCGIYEVAGRVFVDGAKIPIPETEKKIVRAPLLVLWNNTLSETDIPLRVAPSQRDDLNGSSRNHEFLGVFKVRIYERTVKPSYAELLSWRVLGSAEIPSVPVSKLVKPDDCTDTFKGGTPQ